MVKKAFVASLRCQLIQNRFPTKIWQIGFKPIYINFQPKFVYIELTESNPNPREILLWLSPVKFKPNFFRQIVATFSDFYKFSLDFFLKYLLKYRQIKYPVDFDNELKIGDVRYDDMTYVNNN